MGCNTNGRASEALDLLLTSYRSIRPSSDILPSIASDNPEEELLRLCVAISLCGDYTQWGHVHGVHKAVVGLTSFLGLESIVDTRTVDRGVLSHAVWVTLPAVPERSIRECVNIIRRVVRVAATVDYDLSRVASMDTERIRKFARTICSEPVPELFVYHVLGCDSLRPLPSGGSASCMCHLQAGVEWTDGLLGGYPLIRERARDVLEAMPPDMFLALEWWGFRLGCPDIQEVDEQGNCFLCPAMMSCPSLCLGLV